MKIELIKEQEGFGSPTYIVEVDGNYVNGSATYDYDLALSFFEAIKKNGLTKSKEVLITETLTPNQED